MTNEEATAIREGALAALRDGKPYYIYANPDGGGDCEGNSAILVGSMSEAQISTMTAADIRRVSRS